MEKIFLLLNLEEEGLLILKKTGMCFYRTYMTKTKPAMSIHRMQMMLQLYMPVLKQEGVQLVLRILCVTDGMCLKIIRGEKFFDIKIDF